MSETAKSYPSAAVLFVDDDPYALQVYELHCRSRGISHIIICESGQAALNILSSQDIAMIVLDLHMPEMSGEDVLAVVNSTYPNIPVIISTAIDDVETAVRCMKSGAFDYIVKPVNPDHLQAVVKRALEFRELRQENARLKAQVLERSLGHPDAFADIITSNSGMQGIFRYIEAIAATSQPVLITGETGVGKELIAQALHRVSGRRGDIIAVNVAGLDDPTLSDTLFGHVRGAFTGADRSRAGLIEKAANGTLFLDEIGDLHPGSQIKLLRLLQEREYYPLGADSPKVTNARIIVATNRDLLALQSAGTFRQDLYYRLLLHHIHVPPLRERRDDLPLLTEFFLEQAAQELGQAKPTAPPELLTLLSLYDFPGNIRELQAMVFDAVSRHQGGVLSLQGFHLLITEPRQERAALSSDSGRIDDIEALYASLHRLPTLKTAEELLIQEALKRTGGNRTLSASLLGVSRQTLYRRLHTEKSS